MGSSCTNYVFFTFQLTNPTPLFSAVFRKLALTVNSTKYSNEQLGYDIDFALTVATRGFSLQDKWASGYFVDEVCPVLYRTFSILEIIISIQSVMYVVLFDYIVSISLVCCS